MTFQIDNDKPHAHKQHNLVIYLLATAIMVVIVSTAYSLPAYSNSDSPTVVQLGPRPYFLIDDMDDSELKNQLAACADMTMQRQKLAIGHRGAPLQFPEHTKESYLAAARMGAGIIECDVTFTADRKLVCRHSQCDLHATTDILTIPELAKKCTTPFSAAKFNTQGKRLEQATAKCCTSDITLAEFRLLSGKMDAENPNAKNLTEYLNSTANYRTDLYSTRGTLITHEESIKLFDILGVDMMPELKAAEVEMPFTGDYTQQAFAQQMIDEYKAHNISSSRVWPQSFNLRDIHYWIKSEPAFGQQAVYLDGRYKDWFFNPRESASWRPSMQTLVSAGINVLAPPLWVLLSLNNESKIVPSNYALAAKKANLQLITWTLERSGPLHSGGGWYYQSIANAINNDGDMLHALDVLVRDVGVIGVFSDWPATVAYYANCMMKQE